MFAITMCLLQVAHPYAGMEGTCLERHVMTGTRLGVATVNLIVVGLLLVIHVVGDQHQHQKLVRTFVGMVFELQQKAAMTAILFQRMDAILYAK